MSVRIEQERDVEYVTGVLQRFVITTTCLSADPANLPHLNIFVLTINDRTNPKADTLARVARIADLTTLRQSRDVALADAAGTGQEYLASQMSISYDTLDNAQAAKQTILDRINALVTDWTSFAASFNAPDPTPAFYDIPTGDTSQVGVLIAAFKAAKQARYAQQTVKTATDAALTAAQAAFTTADSNLSAFTNFVSTANTLSNEMTTTNGGLSVLITASNVYLSSTASIAPVGTAAAFQTSLNAANGTYLNGMGFQADHAGFVAALSTYSSGTLAPAQAAAAAALTAAQSALLTAQATLTADLATEAAALAAVLVVCPNFDPTSICSVAG